MFLALLATGISLSANLAVLFGFSADDTYIVERYAKNATSAHELSYNLGEKIDALTSPLHALLMIIYSVSAVSPLLLNKMISLIAVGIAALIGAREMGRHQVLIHPSMRGGSDGAGWIFAAAIATSPFVLLWAVAGLETSYVLLLIALLTFLVRTPSPSGLGNRRLVLLGLLVGTAFLGRFDTVVFTGPIVLFALAQRRFGPSAVLSLLPGAALAGAWLLFAWFYYHDIFPTSLYVKPPNLAGTNVIHNIVYIGQFLVFTGVAAPFIAVLISPGSSTSRRDLHSAIQANWGLYLGAFGALAYAEMAATTHMMFGYRLLLPYLAPLLVLSLDTWRAVRGSFARNLAFAVSAVLAVFNLAMGMVVDRVTLNPGLVGEYRQVSAREYQESFMPALQASATDISRDWTRRGGHGIRQPTLFSPVAGLTAHVMPGVRIYDPLTRYRRLCHPDVRRLVNYVQVFGETKGQVPATQAPLGGWVLISARQFHFEGRMESLLVFHVPNPERNVLPPYVNQPCLGS